MANDFIKVARTDSAATEAAELLQFVDVTRKAYELGVAIRAKMRHNFDDSDPQNIDWTHVEALWGVTPGNGVRIFTFVDGAVGAMEGSFQNADAKNVTETVG